MALKLVILSGDRKNEEFVVKDDIIIGRSRGDLTLRDVKASNPHAKISISSGHNYTIEDLNSSNGTFVNGVKINKAELKLGDVIKVGRTEFKLDVLAPAKKGPYFEPGSWQDKVGEALAASKDIEVKANWKPFSVPLCLEFVQGSQLGEKFIFGFGPRKVGTCSTDGLILDPKAAAVLFEIHAGPKDDEPWIIKSVDSSIRLNDQPIQGEKSLKVGDLISFGVNALEVKV